MKRAILLPILLTIILGPPIAASVDDYAARRFRLVRHLEKSGKRAVWWKDGKGFDVTQRAEVIVAGIAIVGGGKGSAVTAEVAIFKESNSAGPDNKD